MNQPLPRNFLPIIDEEDENDVLHEIAEEWAEEIYQEIDDAFPGYMISPAVELPPRQLMEKYLLRLVEAYPLDANARQMELALILTDEYCDAIKAGLVAPPLARPWSILWHVPKVMRKLQAQLRTLWRAYGEPQVWA